MGAVGYIPSIALFCCLRRRWLQSISFQPLCLDLLVVYLASGSSWSFLYHHQFKTMGKTHNKAMYFFIISQVFLDFFLSSFLDCLLSGSSSMQVLPQVKVLVQYFLAMPEPITCPQSISANKLISPYVKILEPLFFSSLFSCLSPEDVKTSLSEGFSGHSI